MARNRVAQITVQSACRLVDVIHEEARQAENEDVKKALLQIGIRIADLALARERDAKKQGQAAA